jgi:hypothetical protein
MVGAPDAIRRKKKRESAELKAGKLQDDQIKSVRLLLAITRKFTIARGTHRKDAGPLSPGSAGSSRTYAR